MERRGEVRRGEVRRGEVRLGDNFTQTQYRSWRHSEGDRMGIMVRRIICVIRSRVVVSERYASP
jgi:hypothetical protein